MLHQIWCRQARLVFKSKDIRLKYYQRINLLILEMCLTLHRNALSIVCQWWQHCSVWFESVIRNKGYFMLFVYIKMKITHRLIIRIVFSCTSPFFYRFINMQQLLNKALFGSATNLIQWSEMKVTLCYFYISRLNCVS